MASASQQAYLEHLERHDVGVERRLDVCLALSCTAPAMADKPVVSVGGLWDTKVKAYVENATTAAPIEVGPWQMPVMRAFLEWLQANIRYRAGKADGMTSKAAREAAWGEWLALYSLHAYGGRRAGKSDVLIKALLLGAVAIPGIITAAVSATRPRTREVRRVIEELLPPAWYRWRSAENTYELINGSTIETHTARTSDLKIGRLGLAMFNEGQLIKDEIVGDIRGGLADDGGLSMLAYNPPRSAIGLWIREENGRVVANDDAHAEAYQLHAKDNPYIDHEALAAIPYTDQQRAREVDGRMDTPIDDVVFPTFTKDGNVIAAVPRGWADITREITKLRTGIEAPWIGGLDFDDGAGNASVLGRIYEVPGRDDWVVAWHMGRREREFAEWQLDQRLQDLEDMHGDRPLHRRRKDVVWVADATALYQNTERDKNKPSSIQQLRGKGWVIVLPDATQKGNPLVDSRFALARRTITERRALFLEHAKELIDATQNYPTHGPFAEPKRRHPHAHITDARTYAEYRLLAPRPGRKVHGSGPDLRKRTEPETW